MAFKPNSEFCKASMNENKQDTELYKEFEKICRTIIGNRIACSKNSTVRPFSEIGEAFIQFKDCTVEDMLFISDIGFFVSERRFYLDIEYTLTSPPIPEEKANEVIKVIKDFSDSLPFAVSDFGSKSFTNE